ncbi:DUF1684 domain-containing protein [Haloquadratum walsbyi]|jgi:Uncharacterized conserved protein|uniref:DUF1684 domain-containing protein n=1 Tax=Haloquadratum walsbyi J07HQW2 TaxID=1238425 RepID=U1PLF9_9EURY|nr:DUF1684 domain-containing protein [Haloquadratum walsbyi]ERG94532.1 MAG: protein of unknown function (DUF1684) [Haloquadratum walsbyi J07HQW2]
MSTTPDDWQEEIQKTRANKEQYFRSSDRSPMPPNFRGESFPGLEYYPINPDYRFNIPLARDDDPEIITVETTADGEQTYRRVGEFNLTVDKTAISIAAYEPTDSTDRLWVPFRDTTSGSETYGAGRYVDLEPAEDHTDNGAWTLDLNRAYNPTCAYNPAYECPLVPAENWLDIPVEAGEKDFPGKLHHEK